MVGINTKMQGVACVYYPQDPSHHLGRQTANLITATAMSSKRKVKWVPEPPITVDLNPHNVRHAPGEQSVQRVRAADGSSVVSPTPRRTYARFTGPVVVLDGQALAMEAAQDREQRKYTLPEQPRPIHP